MFKYGPPLQKIAWLAKPTLAYGVPPFKSQKSWTNIGLDEIVIGDDCRELECGHIFHSGCMYLGPEKILLCVCVFFFFSFSDVEPIFCKGAEGGGGYLPHLRVCFGGSKN